MEPTGTKKLRLVPVLGGVVVVIALAVGGYLWLSEKQPQRYAGPAEKITIAQGVTPNSALVHIAFVEGYFAEQGLDVEMQLHTSGKESARL